MADTTIGVRLEAEDNVSGKVKNIKAELKAAQAEVVTLSEKFGATSKEAAAAAKKAAELKDAIGDAKTLVDAFNPDNRFRAFGASIQGVVGGFTALTGAMGLLGVESENVQKTLLKVQSALALSQGIAQLSDSIDMFKRLGTTLVNTLGKSGLMGIAIAGVAALGAALLGVFDGPGIKIKEFNKSLNELIKGETAARKEVSELKIAFQQVELKIITNKDALDKYNTTMGLTVGQAKDLDEAEKLVATNAKAYITVQGLKAQANYILAQSSAIAGQAAIDEMNLNKSKKEGSALFKVMEATGTVSKIEKKIAESKAAALDLENLIGGIDTKIAEASKGFKGGKATVPGGIAKEKEVEEISAFQKVLKQIEDERLAKEIEGLKLKDITLVKTIDINNAVKASNKDATLSFIQNKQKENEATQQQLAIEEYATQSRLRLTGSIGTALGALSDLVGKQTAAGKVMAIAEATINTYLAASSILKNTARNPVTGAIPGYAIAQMIATIVAGLVTVRNIAKTPVPGAGGGGQGGGSVSPPLTPRLATATNTRLDQAQLNQIGNAAARAYVTESDISNNQERVRRLNRSARIG